MPAIRLNGWARLWIVLVAAWGVTCLSIGAYTYRHLLSPSDLRSSEISIACNKVIDGHYVKLLDVYSEKQIISAAASNGGNTDGAKTAVRDCASVLTKDFKAAHDDNEAGLIKFFFLTFLMPSLALLILGIAVAWVRKGFVKP